MKKRFYVINGGLLLLLVASLILNARYIYGNIGKHYQDTEDEASASNHKTAERKTSASKDVTVLWGNLSISWLPETPLEGWFIDHLREKLGIDILQADHPVCCGLFRGCEKGVDICCFDSSVDFYDRVKEGQLRDLEKDIMEKWPQLYQRYRTSIDQMKADTYKHTGKKGMFGFPIYLKSFHDTWREGSCLAIPIGASHPEQAMELIAYSASDEGIMDIAFGPEGQMWKKEDGRYVLLQDWWSEKPARYQVRKLIQTKDGMEDFATALCKLELVGNERLGRELLAMSSVSRKK